MASDLARRRLPGLTATATRFTPTSGPFAGQACGGVALAVTDPARFEPLRLGAALLAGEDDARLVARWQADHDPFVERRRPHLLYA